MPRNSLTDLDMYAIQVTEQRPDQNIYEFDLTLWTLLSTLAKNAPYKAQVQFSLTDGGIEALVKASENRIARLASGVLIGFRLQTDEEDVLAKLKEAYVPVITLSDTKGAEFDTAYWLLLKRVAQKDHLVAAAAFGLSTTLTLAVSEATDNQLRHLVTNTVTAFTLRFDPQLLRPLLKTEQGSVNANFFLRKYQQSMSHIAHARLGGRQ